MRNHSPLSNTISYQTGTTIIIGADYHHFQYDEGNTNTSTHLSPGHLDLSNSAVFTSCEWKQCSAIEGGAIYIATTNIELEVDKSLFLLCVASSRGGGIFAQSSSSVSVQESFFHSCQSKTTNLSYGGGGMSLYSISTQIQIAFSTVYYCTAQCDGGALDIFTFTPLQTNCPAFYACRFVQCVISSDDWCEGGALLLWQTGLLKRCNTIFVRNEGWAGGACGTNCVSCKPNYQMYFCFFHMNKALLGNDIYFDSALSDSPLLHCFSTTEDQRICYRDGDYKYDKDNWLPMGTSYVKFPIGQEQNIL